MLLVMSIFWHHVQNTFFLQTLWFWEWTRRWSAVKILFTEGGSVDKENPQQMFPVTHTQGRGQSLAPVVVFLKGIDVNESKRLFPTPSLSNLSLKQGRYLSTMLMYFELGLPVQPLFFRHILFIFRSRCNRYFWDMRLKIYALRYSNTLFQFLLTKFSKGELWPSMAKGKEVSTSED